MAKIRKAVIAAAGFGTRFLPQTKAMPKEMLPLVDKPIIQYIVEELVQSGIEDIIIVTGYHKRSIEDHFDHVSAELRHNLKSSGKIQLLDKTKKISELANFAYIRQKGPYGNATALMNSEHLIAGEPCIYTFADDFVVSTPPRFQQLIELYNEFNGSILTCVRAKSDEDYEKYGFVGGTDVRDGLLEVNTIIEKPKTADKAPSNLASVSGYLFTPELFEYLRSAYQKFDAETEGEFKLQPVIQHMINDGLKIYACEVQNAKYYDTGDKMEYLKTNVEFALKNPNIGKQFQEYLEELVKNEGLS
jgi:UTP--glucose-1-phosphate uridylyltransferase